MIAKDRRTVGGSNAGDIDQILDRYRQSCKPARLGFGFAQSPHHQLARMRARALEAQRRQRVHRAVHCADACFERVDQIER